MLSDIMASEGFMLSDIIASDGVMLPDISMVVDSLVESASLQAVRPRAAKPMVAMATATRVFLCIIAPYLGDSSHAVWAS